MDQKTRYEESKKVLRKMKDVQLKERMVEYEMDPNDYTRSGMVDALATKMSEFVEQEAEPEVEEEVVEEPVAVEAPPPVVVTAPVEAESDVERRKYERWPDVARFIIETLRKASKTKPLTYKKLAEVVVKKFPDKDKKKLETRTKTCRTWMEKQFNMKAYGERTVDGPGVWLSEEEYQKGIKE